jgi:hypothetical protein
VRPPPWRPLASLLLAGCAGASEIRGPQGRPAYLIECPGVAAAMGACFREANRLCPSGYAVLDAEPALEPATGGPRRLAVQCFWTDPALAR